MRGDWHNVPEVRGTPQRAGASYRARDVEVADEPGLFRVRLDLAAAYPVGGLERWWRTALLDRSSGEVTIEDAWRFTGDGEPSALRFLLAERGAAGRARGGGGAAARRRAGRGPHVGPGAGGRFADRARAGRPDAHRGVGRPADPAGAGPARHRRRVGPGAGGGVRG
ncbi:hypothetical protein ACFSTC_41605 [Nonomuraea ferruginea]